jgi:hypothetical protein
MQLHLTVGTLLFITKKKLLVNPVYENNSTENRERCIKMSGKMQSFNGQQNRDVLHIMLSRDASSVLQFVPHRENTASPLMLYREIVSRPIYCECDIKKKYAL